MADKRDYAKPQQPLSDQRRNELRRLLPSNMSERQALIKRLLRKFAAKNRIGDIKTEVCKATGLSVRSVEMWYSKVNGRAIITEERKRLASEKMMANQDPTGVGAVTTAKKNILFINTDLTANSLTDHLKSNTALGLEAIKRVLLHNTRMVVYYSSLIDDIIQRYHGQPKDIPKTERLQIEYYEKQIKDYTKAMGEYIKPSSISTYIATLDYRQVVEDASIGGEGSNGPITSDFLLRLFDKNGVVSIDGDEEAIEDVFSGYEGIDGVPDLDP